MTRFQFSNRTIAIAIAAFAVAYLVAAFRMPDFAAVDLPVQSYTLPRWLGIALLVLAVALFFERTERPTDAPSDTHDADEQAQPAPATSARLGRLGSPAAEIGLFVGSLGLYVLAFEPLGFVLATALYLAALTWYLGYPRHLVNGVVSVAVPLVLYLTMSVGLDVALPTGPLPL
ncbi:tripartite tricarboxylate transporter TctB family protein [Haloechinothrix salitolerans]|uniref:Tripartite tricarboxylate transporter TctB family protein n=1 Tax=Haloechinothrix salitolerans TaxID=926830 RepID=A0ABW2C5J8_9PSEU